MAAKINTIWGQYFIYLFIFIIFLLMSIQQGFIKLIKSDNKDIQYYKNAFELSKESFKKHHSFHKNSKQQRFQHW